MRDDALATREHADAYGLNLQSDLYLHLPCTVAAGAGKGRRWSTVPYRAHQHTTSVTQEGGTTTGSTWIGDGKRQEHYSLTCWSAKRGRLTHRTARRAETAASYAGRSRMMSAREREELTH